MASMVTLDKGSLIKSFCPGRPTWSPVGAEWEASGFMAKKVGIGGQSFLGGVGPGCKAG